MYSLLSWQHPQHWCCLTQNAIYRNSTKWHQIICFLSNRIQRTKRKNRKHILQVKFYENMWYKEFHFKDKTWPMLSQSFAWPSLKITDFIFFLFYEALNINDALKYFFKYVSSSRAKLALKSFSSIQRN